MLGTLTAALVLLTPIDSNRHTLKVTVHPWSTASFNVSVNGKEIFRLSRKAKIDLGEYLRPGGNTIEVRYQTRDGKPSLLQPATLIVEADDRGRKREPVRIVVSEDNPRGKITATLHVD